MFEVELKAYLERKNAVIAILDTMQLQKKEDVMYEDCYFDTNQKDFLKTEKELRVRRITNEASKVVLTFKDQPFDNVSKSKPEIEVEVSDYNNIISLIKSLGFLVDISFSKQCSNYYFKYGNKDVLVTLVEVPEIEPSFIELEILVKSKSEIEPAMQNLYSLLEKLNIPNSSLTNEYYTDLIRNVRNKSL